MTFYFDEAIKQADHAVSSVELDAVDARVVFDVSICTEMPGFPEELREKANRAMLLHSAARTPVNHPGPGYESFHEHRRGVMKMIDVLHSVFHYLADARVVGFGDDPRTPLNIIYSRSEERREELSRKPS